MSSQQSPNGESLIVAISDHWIKFVIPVFVYILLLGISVVMFLFAGVTAYHYIWLTGGIYIFALLLFLVTHHWFFAMLLSEANERILVTDKRVIHRQMRLFFYDDINEFSFDKMKTVEARKKGFLQNVLQYGSLVFEKSFEIKLVPHPDRVARQIEQAMGRL